MWLHPEHHPGRGGTGRTLLGIVTPLPPTLSPPQAILSMLQDMNFINNYKMDRQTLTRWVPIPVPMVTYGTPG